MEEMDIEDVFEMILDEMEAADTYEEMYIAETDPMKKEHWKKMHNDEMMHAKTIMQMYPKVTKIIEKLKKMG